MDYFIKKAKPNNTFQTLERARKAVAQYVKGSLLDDLKQMRREEFLKEELECEQYDKTCK